MKITRIYSLDYLRGLSAFWIMIYHFMMFGVGSGKLDYQFDISGGIERIAIYGVSIFYILSGLTLYLVYQRSDFSKFNEVKRFFIKRGLRIFPLFILVTLFFFIFIKREFSFDSFLLLILNITGLFSIFAFDKYFVTGGWSIGNELSFYLLFPVLMFFIKKYKNLFWITLVSLLCIYVYFAYVVIIPELPLSNNWNNYINPFNQAFLFVSGMALGYYITAQHSTAQHSTDSTIVSFLY